MRPAGWIGLALLGGCATSRAVPADEDGGRARDAGAVDGGDGAPACESVCFAWDPRAPVDPWEGPPPDGAACGASFTAPCPSGSRCARHEETGLDACVPEGTSWPVLRIDPDAAQRGRVPVVVRLELNGAPFPEPRRGGGLALEGEGGFVARVPLPEEGPAEWSLHLDPGVYRLTLDAFDRIGILRAVVAPRTGTLRVVAAGRATVPVTARLVRWDHRIGGAGAAGATGVARFVSAWGGVGSGRWHGSDGVPRWLEPGAHVAELDWWPMAGTAAVRFEVPEGEGQATIRLESRLRRDVDLRLRFDGEPTSEALVALADVGPIPSTLAPAVPDQPVLLGRPYQVVVLDEAQRAPIAIVADAWEPGTPLDLDLETVQVAARFVGGEADGVVSFRHLASTEPGRTTAGPPSLDVRADETGTHRVRLPARQRFEVRWSLRGDKGILSSSYEPSPELLTIDPGTDTRVPLRVTLDDVRRTSSRPELLIGPYLGGEAPLSRCGFERITAGEDGGLVFTLRGGPHRFWACTADGATQLAGWQALSDLRLPAEAAAGLAHALVTRTLTVERVAGRESPERLLRGAAVVARACLPEAASRVAARDPRWPACPDATSFPVEALRTSVRVFPGLFELSWACDLAACAGPDDPPDLRVFVP